MAHQAQRQGASMQEHRTSQSQSPSSSEIAQSPNPMKTYTMYYTLSRCNITLHLGPSTSPPKYYGEIRWQGYFTDKPQLRLRAGDSKSAPIVAAAKLHTTSRNLQLGIGNPDENTVWEELRREKTRFKHSDYKFDTSIADGAGLRRAYSWRRENYTMRTRYVCFNDEGKMVASMFSGGMLNWKKGGEINVLEDIDQSFAEFLILSAISVWFAEAGWSFRQGYQSGR